MHPDLDAVAEIVENLFYWKFFLVLYVVESNQPVSISSYIS